METKIFDEKGYESKNPRPIEYVVNDNNCWICISHTKDKKGYPVLYRYNKFYRMSRYVYEVSKGIIPLKNVVMHKCDNPNCINPEHLSVGTTQDNTKDMINKNRQAKGSLVGGSKLTESDVIKIMEMLEKGMKHKEIAEMFNVDRTNITAIKNKKSWKHLL